MSSLSALDFEAKLQARRPAEIASFRRMFAEAQRDTLEENANGTIYVKHTERISDEAVEIVVQELNAQFVRGPDLHTSQGAYYTFKTRARAPWSWRIPVPNFWVVMACVWIALVGLVVYLKYA